MKIAIHQGRVICPANNMDTITDILIDNGKISYIGKYKSMEAADKTIDAQGKWVLPGLIDMCHRPQMQHPHGTTLQDEAASALKRGITSMCIPPDGEPIVDNAASVMRLIKKGELPLPNIYPIGALTSHLNGESIADLTALHDAGCIALSNAQHPIKDLQILRQCYEYASSFNLAIIIQPYDNSLAKNGVAHEGVVATRLGLPGIPYIAETIAIAQHLLLIEQCDVRAHFTCLSSSESVAQIREAKAKGLKVSADTAMHSLHLTENDILNFDANCHLYPPLRSIRDQEALIQGVNDGTIDAICSDHRPLETIAKLAPFGDTVAGLSALDTYLSLGLHLVYQKKLELTTLISALTYRAANLFQLPAGTLSIGAWADICIVSPEQYWAVEDNNMFSKGKNSPFKGWEVPGLVTHTLLKGNIVYEF